MPPVDGLGFGGRVWSYGDLGTFCTDYREAQREVEQGRELEPLPPPKGEPPDEGLSRYLSSSGDDEIKRANLSRINTFVEKYKLENGGALPESKQQGTLTPDDVAQKVFGADGVDRAVQTLTRLLEKKLLAAKRAEPGQEHASLSPDECDVIARNCRTALEKMLFAASLRETFAELRPDGARHHAFDEQKAALLNAALGVAEMLQNEQISEDAVITLMNDGKLLDMTNVLDVTEMLKDAAEAAKENFTREKELYATLDRKFPDRNSADYAEAKRAIDRLVAARKKFTRVLDFEIHAHDPSGLDDDAHFRQKQLESAKLRLQQFRFDLQRCTNEVGKEFGHSKFSFYGVMERLRRSLSNLRGDRHLEQRFKSDSARNEAFRELARTESRIAATLLKLHSDWPTDAEDVFARAKSVCALTHNANDGARLTQAVASEKRAWLDYGNQVLDLLRDSGGMRSVVTDVSFSGAFSIGSKGFAEAQASVGVFKKKAVTLACNKNGGFALTISDVKGVRGGVAGTFADGEGEAQVTGDLGHGHETTLTFANKEEVIAFCRRNAPNLLQTIPGALLMTNAKTVAREALPLARAKYGKILSLGRFLGNALGLRIHKSKNFSEARFESRLRQDGVFTKLDSVLAERQNALALNGEKQTTENLSGNAQAGFGDKVGVAAGAGLTVKHHAKEKFFQTARQAFARHTAAEMREEVEAAFGRYDDYRRSLAIGPQLDELVGELKELAAARPDAGKDLVSFWLGQTEKLRARYGEIEDIVVREPNFKKNKNLQILFAETTRLFAVVNEAMAKGAEADGVSLAAETARADLGARLTRPRLALKPEIFYERVQFGREVSPGKTVQFTTSLDANWNADLNQNSGRVTGRATTTLRSDNGADVPPWQKTDTMQFDLEVEHPVNFHVIYRAVEKLVRDTIRNHPQQAAANRKMLDALKDFAAVLGVGVVGAGLNAVDVKLIGGNHSSGLGVFGVINKILGPLGFGLDSMEADRAMSKGGKLSFKFEDGAFTTFTYSDYVSAAKSTNIGLKTPITPVAFSVNSNSVSRQETVAFEAMAKLSLATLLERGMDLLATNGKSGPDKVASFLRKHQWAVNGLVADLRRTTDPVRLQYADVRLQEIRRDLERLREISHRVTHPAKLAADASEAYRKLFGDPGGVWAKLAKPKPEGESDADRVTLVTELMQSLAAAYDILTA